MDTTMREELRVLAQSYQDGKSLYLRGPIGVGKTYLCESIPRDYLGTRGGMPSGFFVLISRERYDWDGSQGWRSEHKTFACSFEKNGEASGWKETKSLWQELHLPHLSQVKNLDLSEPQAWKLLVDLLEKPRYERIVLIVDDYDRWPGDEWIRASQEMEKCLGNPQPHKPHVIFWLTGEKRLRTLREITSPADAVIRGIMEVQVQLPTDDDISILLREHTSSGMPWLQEHLTQSSTVSRVNMICGSYPALLVAFAQGLNHCSMHEQNWERAVQWAETSTNFMIVLKTLFGSLDDRQQQVLGLFAIADESTAHKDLIDISDLRATWEARHPAMALPAPDVEKIVHELQVDRLLLGQSQTSNGKPYVSIRSSALRKLVLQHPITVGLKVQTGTPRQSGHRRSQIRFVRILTLGILWYVLVAFTHAFWSGSLPTGLHILVYFFGMLIALFYFVFMVFKERSLKT
ncbi:MAG: hypothetical protein WA040_19525 [Anaerolineae bacterium]